MIQNSKKYAGIVLLAMILLSSCATFLNSRLQKIYINTPKNVKIISVDRSILVDSLVKRKRERKTYFVQRSKLPIKVIVQVDSTQKTILLKPKYMFASWANFCFNNGLSMLVDTNNKRCYRYQISNYIREYKGDVGNKVGYIKAFKPRPPDKGTLKVSLAVPIVTDLIVNNPNGHSESGGGLIGGEIGLDYYYSKRNYLSATIGFGTDVIPLPIDYFGPHRQSVVAYANIRNNRVAGWFDIGYGLNISKYHWYLEDDTTQRVHNISNVGLGASFSADYRVNNFIRFGILYQPNLLNLSFKPTIDYEHYFSVNIIFKLPLNKKVR